MSFRTPNMTSSVWTTVLLMVGISYVASKSWVVEVYFVVEPKVVKDRLSLGYNASMAESTIRSDIDYFIYQINKFYKSLEEYGLSIEIRAKQLDILTEEIFEDCHMIKSEYLQDIMALEIAKKWLAKKDAYKTVGYDTVVVYTGFDLFVDNNDAVAGVAYRKKTCKEGNGIVVVEFDGTMKTAVVTANDIGHSLGAEHEPGNLTSPCSSHFGWIMSANVLAINANRWTFSSCTAIAIKKYISSLSNNCLNSTTAPAPTFQLADAVNSDIMDAEKICQRDLKNPSAYFCHYDDFFHQAKGDEVCQKLMCGAKQGPLICLMAMPSDGMICDTNKRCEKGRCVTSSIPTGEVDTNCVFGDIQSESIFETGLTCPQYIGTDDYKCYKDWVHRERCCRTCGQKRRDIQGCEYGDKSNNCGKHPIDETCGRYSEICCETCRNYTTSKRSQPSHHTLTITDLSNDPVSVPHAKEGPEENDNIMKFMS